MIARRIHDPFKLHLAKVDLNARILFSGFPLSLFWKYIKSIS